MGFISAVVNDRKVKLILNTFKKQIFFELAWVPVLLLNLCFKLRFLLRWSGFQHSTVFILKAFWLERFLIIHLISVVLWGKMGFIKLSLNLFTSELSLQKWILMVFRSSELYYLNNYQWKLQITFEGLSFFHLNYQFFKIIMLSLGLVFLFTWCPVQ